MNDLLRDFDLAIEKVKTTVHAKNADYGREGDPWSNFRLAEHFGVADVETAIMVRLLDKVSRIANLTKKEASVKSETIQDTLLDLSAYTLLLSVHYEQRARESLSGMQSQ